MHELNQVNSTEIYLAFRAKAMAADEKFIYTDKGTPIPVKRAWAMRKLIAMRAVLRRGEVKQ